jgi:hypothetical protein
MTAPGFRLPIGEQELPDPIALDEMLAARDHRQVARPQRPIGEEGDNEAIPIFHGGLEWHDFAVRKVH